MNIISAFASMCQVCKLCFCIFMGFVERSVENIYLLLKIISVTVISI